MASQFIRDVYSQLHRDELDRMERLDASVGLPAGVATVLFGVGSTYLTNFPSVGAEINLLAFAVFGVTCIAFFAFLLLATYLLFRSVFRGEVVITARPNLLAEYVEELNSYYRNIGENDDRIPGLVDEEIRDALARQHLICSTENRANNMVQARRINRAKSCIAGAIAALILSAIPFFFIQRSDSAIVDVRLMDSDAIHRIEMTDPDSNGVTIDE